MKTRTMIFGKCGIGIPVDEGEAEKLRRNGQMGEKSSLVTGAYYWTDEFGNEYVTDPVRP